MNKYLVQYYPINGQIGRILYINDETLATTQQNVNKFYDVINISDYQHNSIVLTVEAENMFGIKEEITKAFQILYGGN